MLDTNRAALIALLKTMAKSVCGYYHVSSKSVTKIMKSFEEISSINAAVVCGHKIKLTAHLPCILHEVDVGKNFIAVELLAPCMFSMRATMKNCWTINR